jgi:hypothetical protein
VLEGGKIEMETFNNRFFLINAAFVSFLFKVFLMFSLFPLVALLIEGNKYYINL